ncbi:AAA family ATPase [Candidatus Dependentiae bacterium]|nr:AAA family ATPase [Candidatus Dependentiae bacterium]
MDKQKNQNLHEIETLIRARYPIIYIVTHEEYRVKGELFKIGKKLNKNVFEWSITNGVIRYSDNIDMTRHPEKSTKDPTSALSQISTVEDPAAIFILNDFHPYLKDSTVIRKLKETANNFINSFKSLIIISPVLLIPCELEKEITVIDFDLPTEEDLKELLFRVKKELKDAQNIELSILPDVVEDVINSITGLTLQEAENVLAKVIIENKKITREEIKIILNEKKQVIRKSEILEYYTSDEGFNNIGGLENLKIWLRQRKLAFSEKAEKFGLPKPKGVLLLGVQGCGKSLCAKAISTLWNLPLLRLDMGKIFGSLVGSSEDNIRRAIKTAESISPCIVWIDEIEKALSGVQSSGSTDAGTTSRVFGTFITWLQEKTKPVFVIATANDVTMLPPELMRKGRFDEIFFVDLPTHNERKTIFKIHLDKRERTSAEFDLEKLATVSTGFSGAEIEQVIIASLYEAFYNNTDIDTEIVTKKIKSTVPLSRLMKERIDSLRTWAKGRTISASYVETD